MKYYTMYQLYGLLDEFGIQLETIMNDCEKTETPDIMQRNLHLLSDDIMRNIDRAKKCIEVVDSGL